MSMAVFPCAHQGIHRLAQDDARQVVQHVVKYVRLLVGAHGGIEQVAEPGADERLDLFFGWPADAQSNGPLVGGDDAQRPAVAATVWSASGIGTQ